MSDQALTVGGQSIQEKAPRAWEAAFLANLAACPNVSKACEMVGISRAAAYEYRNSNEDFRKRWQDALDKSLDDLLEEVFKRAKDGVLKPVYQSARLVGYVSEPSDQLAIFLLKHMRPETFGTKTTHEHSGPGGGPIPVQIEDALKRIYGSDRTIEPPLLDVPSEPLPSGAVTEAVPGCEASKGTE